MDWSPPQIKPESEIYWPDIYSVPLQEQILYLTSECWEASNDKVIKADQQLLMNKPIKSHECAKNFSWECFGLLPRLSDIM